MPKDVNIKHSKDIRKHFDRHYPDILLKHARISPGGSYVLETVSEDDANVLDETWDNDHFGGNSGLAKLDDKNKTGLVKYVYDDYTEDFITSEIQRNYPGVKYELFKRDDEFTGMIKVTFKDDEELKTVIANKFRIDRRLYLIEPFERKPRVIKCNTCQRFGHVSRLCRSKDNPVCGKCCGNHETKNCQADQADYKCYHCGKTDHFTGSKSCEKMKEKYQDIIDRQNG